MEGVRVAQEVRGVVAERVARRLGRGSTDSDQLWRTVQVTAHGACIAMAPELAR